jgi:UMF1 family MFS transporter
MTAPAHRGGATRAVFPARILWPRTVSWALYDFANTIYSALVVSYAITLHVKEFTGVERYTFIAGGGSLLASGLVLPFAGEIADRTGRPKRYLLCLTLVTCACCVAMSFAAAAWLILVFFCIANFSYNSSLTFYDSLMPTLAPRERLGFVSGLGVGLGYAGVLLALPMGSVVIGMREAAGAEHTKAPLFALAGGLFMLFSLPLFLFVPEKPATRAAPPGRSILRLAWKRVLVTLRLLPRHRRVMLFLLGNFLLVDSLITGIMAAAPYMRHVFGLTDRQALAWMMPFSLGAALMGAVGGRLADRIGPRRGLLYAGAAVGAAVVACSVTRSFSVFAAAFIVFGGYGLANIWVSGRKMLVELVPPGQLGKYFGLYNVGHKLSLIGSVAFGMLADVHVPGIPAGGYRLGLLFELLPLSLGLVLIHRLREDRKRDD